MGDFVSGTSMKRPKFEELRQRVVPENIVYHYTGQQGLLGILGKGKVWATHIQYMNDYREFIHGIDLAHEVINEHTDKEEDHSNMNDTYGKLRALKSEAEMVLQVADVFVVSFSELEDSLSQWRAYGDEFSGFAIGFNAERLQDIGAEYGFELFRCEYGRQKQKQLVWELVDYALKDEFKDIPVMAGDRQLGVSKMSEVFWTELTRLAPLLKDKAFEGEREWRLVSSPDHIRPRRVNCVNGGSTERERE